MNAVPMTKTAVICLFLLCFVGLGSHAASPPIAPHIIGWNSEIDAWCQGAPWIKVIYSYDIPHAKATGAKVFYRPWDADSVNHDDGCLPSAQTGSQYADLVWDKIKNLSQKPDAVSYRNEFNWDAASGSCQRRTCTEFLNYKNRLRERGYTGKIVFGSFGVGWVDSGIWDEPEVRAATDAADAVETHEYFDLTVDCCSPWLTFRHRDLAINAHPDHLGNKEWFIGEFGSDRVCGACPSCDDDLCRQGWRDRDKLNEEQYIEQMTIYRAGCHNNVTAVFVFQQGSTGWWDFEVLGTSVATWMKSTWSAPTGTVAGTVKNTSNVALSGAVLTVSPGGYTAESGANGYYSITDIPVGTYDITCSKAGYGQQTQTGKIVVGGQTTSANFMLSAVMSISSAKALVDGTPTLVEGIVTAQFPVGQPQTRIYIEDASRSTGIGIATSAAASLGSRVQAQGNMATSDGERILSGSTLNAIEIGLPIPEAMGFNSRSLGGGSHGLQAAVLDDSSTNKYASGANNIGLLARVWGRVTYVDSGGTYFYMDDGSGIVDGSGHTGVRVASAGLPEATAGTYVVIRGISSTTVIGGKVVRLIRPRSASDLSYVSSINYLANPGFEMGSLANWTKYSTFGNTVSGSWFGGITAHSGNWFAGTAVDGGTASGGLYQRVAVPNGFECEARAWSRVFHLNNPTDSAQNRVGIDPTGGTNPASAAVVWSAVDVQLVEGYSEWRELIAPTVTCTGGYITIFLDAQQYNAAGWHINCFDDAGVSAVY